MIPEGWERLWSEHSERTTLPSALAALGIHKDERGLIGRWLPECPQLQCGSLPFAEAGGRIRSGAAYETFDEGSILEGLKDWMVSLNLGDRERHHGKGGGGLEEERQGFHWHQDR